MKALITGATGLVGRALAARLEAPVVLSRSPERARDLGGGAVARGWDPSAGPPEPDRFDGVDVVFHLAGEPVAEGRWTADKKRRIEESRTLGTARLVSGMKALDRKPRALVCASAVGYYGDRGDEILTESAEPGDDFLARVCRGWEAAAREAEGLGVRVVCMRLGLVLSERGGALAKMLPPFRLGVGGRLGDGQQWMPWVHLDDVVGLMLLAAQSEAASGAINVVAPRPARNRDFTRALGRACHRPALLPVPKAALKLAFGELAGVLLASQRAEPAAARELGYEFAYPELEPALRACVERR